MKKVLFIFAIGLVLLSGSSDAQETKTLLGPDTDVSFVWGTELKTGDIKGDIGTSIGFMGGALFDQKYMLGAVFGANVTHPDVNHSYIGLLANYTHKPSELLHCYGQLVLGAGSTKDYERKKSSTMDNFGNTTGPGFYYVEPEIGGEVNLSGKVRLKLGLSYSMVTGLDEDDKLIAKTKVTDKDLSGFHFNIGLKIGAY